MSRYNYRRRPTRRVAIGSVVIGGGSPIALQSMTNTDTLDTAASAAQAIRIAQAGGDIVRLTTQGEAQANALADVRARLDSAGYSRLPIVADVHFNPKAALGAAHYSGRVSLAPIRLPPARAERSKVVPRRRFSLSSLCRSAGAGAFFYTLSRTNPVKNCVEKGSIVNA